MLSLNNHSYSQCSLWALWLFFSIVLHRSQSTQRAVVIYLTRRHLFNFDIGRVSTIVTISPSFNLLASVMGIVFFRKTNHLIILWMTECPLHTYRDCFGHFSRNYYSGLLAFVCLFELQSLLPLNSRSLFTVKIRAISLRF